MKRASPAPAAKASYSDPLAEVLRPGQSIELLKELHILTRDGKLNQDSRRKLKQVYHLCNFIEPLLNDVLGRQDTLTPVIRPGVHMVNAPDLAKVRPPTRQ